MTKLVEHLARCEAESLVSVLGESTVTLLKIVGRDALNQSGLAYLIVSMYGGEGALRNRAIRELLFSKLNNEEGQALCKLLQLPTYAVQLTLNGVDFDNNVFNFDLLMRWFGVSSQNANSAGRNSEWSRKAIANHKLRTHQLVAFRKLRKSIASPDTSVLVHMPIGAGKLRLVATAILDLYRSEPDGRVIVWLAAGEALCDEAFTELREVWEQIGSRDVTIFRLYGDRPGPDLGSLENCIVVADITRLSDKGDGLELLGRKTRIVVVGDAEHVVHPVGANIIERFSKSGAFSLVAMSASPACIISSMPSQLALRAKFSGSYITIDDEGANELVRNAGSVVEISGEIRHIDCVTAEFDACGSLEFSSRYIDDLGRDVDRNRFLLELLIVESRAVGRIIFFATTAEHARLFAGLLALRGVTAMSVTSELAPEERELIIQKFNAQNDKVLCVHGIFVLGDSVPEATVCIVAAPTLSASVFLGMVGRLASARNVNKNNLRVVVVSDSLPGRKCLVEALSVWDKLDL